MLYLDGRTNAMYSAFGHEEPSVLCSLFMSTGAVMAMGCFCSFSGEAITPMYLAKVCGRGAVGQSSLAVF